MPLFVLLSGFYSKRFDNTPALLQALKGIAIPLVIFQAISLLLLVSFKQEFSLQYLIRPYWTLWYLMSLLFWRIFLQFTPKKLLMSPILYLTMAVIVSIVSGLCLPFGHVFSIQRTFSFYPFFLLGYYMGKSRIIIPVNRFTKAVAWGFIIIISCLFVFNLMPDYINRLLLGAYRYPINHLPVKLLLLLCSVLMSLSFFIIFKECSVLAKIGRDSLFFYLWHGIFIQFILLPLSGLLHFSWNGFTITFCFLLTIIVLKLMSEVRLFRWITNPLQYKYNTIVDY